MLYIAACLLLTSSGKPLALGLTLTSCLLVIKQEKCFVCPYLSRKLHDLQNCNEKVNSSKAREDGVYMLSPQES
jgi:hypothetical protein